MVSTTSLFHPLLHLTLFHHLAVTSLMIPRPDGPFSVSISNLTITDPARTDAYADGNRDRAVPISLFFPIPALECTKNCTTDYMPCQTARISSSQFFGNDSGEPFDQLQFQTCCSAKNPANPEQYPLVILDGDVNTSRYLYGVLAQRIAAHGYTVVIVDHPYDSSIVELPQPDGEVSVIYNSVPLSPFEPITEFNDTIAKAMLTRADDIALVLKNLVDPRVVQQLLPTAPFGVAFNTSSVGILGHGMGGGCAVMLTFIDSRVTVAIDWDGTPPVFIEPTNHTVVFLGREDHTRDTDIGWKRTIEQVKGPFWEWDRQDAGHFDYSDLPLIADLAGIPEGKVKGLGKGRSGSKATAGFSTVHLNIAMKMQDIAQLENLVRLYPEMVPYEAR